MVRVRTVLLLLGALAAAAGFAALRAHNTSGAGINPSAAWFVNFTGDEEAGCGVQFYLIGGTLTSAWECGDFGHGNLSGPIEKVPGEGAAFDINGLFTRTHELTYGFFMTGTIDVDGVEMEGEWNAAILGTEGTFSGIRLGAPPPTATPTFTPTPTWSPTPTLSPTPSVSPTPSLSPTPTSTPTATATPTRTATATRTATSTRGPLPGDANCDGHVTAVDASLVLQYEGGLITSLPCPANADANNDGEIDSVDAAIILSIVVGVG